MSTPEYTGSTGPIVMTNEIATSNIGRTYSDTELSKIISSSNTKNKETLWIWKSAVNPAAGEHISTRAQQVIDEAKTYCRSQVGDLEHLSNAQFLFEFNGISVSFHPFIDTAATIWAKIESKEVSEQNTRELSIESIKKKNEERIKAFKTSTRLNVLFDEFRIDMHARYLKQLLEASEFNVAHATGFLRYMQLLITVSNEAETVLVHGEHFISAFRYAGITPNMNTDASFDARSPKNTFCFILGQMTSCYERYYCFDEKINLFIKSWIDSEGIISNTFKT